ncbi:MAG: tRNA 4-thiouridine(8) synthase ThiI [Thaumarchaeota archaeon]|nr:tRNA 4-thiouridine(8) synthase ThiI [Nitrososphaerota archaeon]
MTETFVVHYSEIALKGKNRPDFVRVLRRNVSRSLSHLQPVITSESGRLLLTVEGDTEEVEQRLATVFGLAWFARAEVTKAEVDQIRAKVMEVAARDSGASFKIDARRSDKSFPLTSAQLAQELGAEVVAQTGRKVDLSHPDSTIHVDILKGQALIYSDKQDGPGGLPVGTAGRVVHLFSGGIDSPVAAWLMMKRGCTPVYLHFYLAPTPAYPLNSKVTKLVKKLSAHSGKTTLILMPFADYQLATFGAPGELEPSLFRRFMRMTAEALAPVLGASGISTGDSLSQAASQTLWNLRAFDEGSSLPILRPLLSYDKEEIVALARKIGTYEQSLEEYKDCCAIVTRHPRTRVKPDAISEYVRVLGLRKLVTESIEHGTLVTYNPTTDELKSVPLREGLHLQEVLPEAEAKL